MVRQRGHRRHRRHRAGGHGRGNRTRGHASHGHPELPRGTRSPPTVNLPLILLSAYSIVIVGLGLWTARFVRRSSDFFVAGRSLGPWLIFASMLAANVGA